MVIIKKLMRIFDRGTKVRLLVLLFAIVIGALIETLALSLISPFISILLDNSMIQTNRYIKWIYDFLGKPGIGTFLALLTFLLAAVYIFRGVYLYAVSRVQYRFIARRQAEYSGVLLSKILGFSYLYHTKHNIAELQRIIIIDVQSLFELITNALLLMTDFFISLAILIFLMIISPIMTLCIVLLALLCVGIYLKAFRKQVHSAGERARDASIGMTKAVNQALGGIKEVKILRRESYFHQAFRENSDVFVNAFTRFKSLDAMPKLVVESVCFGGAFIILGLFILSGADIATLVPQLSVFVLAAFRLLPAVSRQINYANAVIYQRASVDAVYRSLFEETEENMSAAPIPALIEKPDAGNDIVVQNISFRYPEAHEPVLENVSLNIPNNKSVAVIGSSGAGKTTLADLILGILTPETGGVFYRGNSIHHNFEDWSKHIGYIPQLIYLLDESIMENVAFGIARRDIDEKKVWRALEQAQLKEFVESLPEGLFTVVGDNGVRLSGGQRQRIGIARAIYEDPPILVLDEATSSLDSDTERAIMDAVMGFKGNKTMLIVAHRLSTIEHCDIIYRVEGKTVKRER